ncbi:DnaA ATPase domain-containing protein [Mycoplasmopsis gallinarum]|uniref:DnaA ATPase domain-containing protein n=1 Tax=Mycoplasmopsis gallinarum TaxID=29557 RepID=UPI00047FC04E|nr:DnaA/Hda family protein [Mycoplasmopsis gallinarum]
MKNNEKLSVNDFLFGNQDEYNKKVLKTLHSHPKIENIIQEYQISDAEILQFAFELIELKEKFDFPDIVDFSYEIKRDKEKNKLIFKKVKDKTNKFKFNVTRVVNLKLTEISAPDPTYTVDNLIINSKVRREIRDRLKHIKKFVSNNNFSNVKGLFLENGTLKSGKSFLLQAASNYLASEGITVAYIKLPKLFNHLISLFNIQNSSMAINAIKNEMSKVDVLLIDDLGLEKINSWFFLDFLGDILDNRFETFKINIFASIASFEELRNIYAKSFPNQKIRVKNLFDKIYMSTYLINFNEKKQNN